MYEYTNAFYGWLWHVYGQTWRAKSFLRNIPS
jgi:hypothetical protein